jgi:hypothetical protein
MIDQEIMERLKNVRIFVNNKSESKEIQEIAFSMDIPWGSGEKKYLDWGWSSSINNIVFRRRGERLVMLRGAGTDGGRITIDELRNFAESMKRKESSASIVAKETPIWTPKAGDKVRCIKTDGFPLDPKNFLLSAGIKLGEEYTVESFTDTYALDQKGLRLEGYQSTHPLSSFEPAKESKPEWIPSRGDIVRCISESGYLADLPSNYTKADGIKIGQEYEVSRYLPKYSPMTEERGIALQGFPSTHPITSFEPVKKKMITFDIETDALMRILPTPGDVGKSSFGHVHFIDHVDHWRDQFIKSSGIPADRFGAWEHAITTSSFEGIGHIARSVGADAILRVQKNRRGYNSPDNVVVPTVQKARKVNPERVEVEALPYINVPYRGKITKRIPEVKITKPEVHAYYTV